MGITLNLTADEIKSAQGNFEALPEGTYGAVIYDSKFGESKSSKNPMYTLTFKIKQGPAGINRTIRGYFVLTAKALFKVIELHKALDLPYPKSAADAGSFEFPDADEYVGNKVNLVIVREPYESVDDDGNDVTEFRNNIKFVKKYDEDKHTTEDELAEDGDSDEKNGMFL